MNLSPEPFSLSPLLSLLPTVGSVARLEGLVSSLFARYESVESARENPVSVEVAEQLAAESTMLRQILDWLSVQPDEARSADE